MVLSTVLTIVLVLLLVAVLVVGLVAIAHALERIGGGARGYMGERMGDTPSLLAKARWGVRAIEVQTGAIGPEVARLNEGLGALEAELAGVRDGVAALVAAVRRQGGGA